MSRKKRSSNEVVEGTQDEVDMEPSMEDSGETYIEESTFEEEAVVEEPVVVEAPVVQVAPVVVPEPVVIPQPVVTPVKEEVKVNKDDNKLVRLDGSPVSMKHIRDQQAGNPNVRIVETNPGEYKTLQRMRG